MLIWLFAIVVAYPFVPGSASTAFKGVSVFAGVVLTLGSSGLANQILSGFMLIYSRALRPGDVVTVGETFGVVTGIGTVSTKILTPQQEEVTIPNTLMLGSSVTNYTRTDALVSTTVTIGYDAPWRQVESLLLLAAERTPGLRREPPPIVWQRALSDFYVEYTLLCPIERQIDRYPVLADLHSKIQDAFNEFGVQIMSPHFLSQPDGRVIAPPESWYARPAKQPSRRVRRALQRAPVRRRRRLRCNQRAGRGPAARGPVSVSLVDELERVVGFPIAAALVPLG